MRELLSNGFKYIRRAIQVKQNYRKLKKKEINYNQQIVKLGKKFEDLNLENKEAYQFLGKIKDTNSTIKEIEEKIALLEKEVEKEEQMLQKEKSEHHEKNLKLSQKQKGLEKLIQPIQKRKRAIEKDIHGIEKNIKKLEYDKRYVQKEISGIENKPQDTEEEANENISVLMAEIEEIDNEINDLNKKLPDDYEKLKKVREELIPCEKDLHEVKEEIDILKQDWKNIQNICKKTCSENRSIISDESSQKEDLEAKKIIPYRELGIISMKEPIENDEIKSIIQTLVEEGKEIEEIKNQVVELEMVMLTPQSKKSKILLATFFILIILLVIVISVSFGGNGELNQITPTQTGNR